MGAGTDRRGRELPPRARRIPAEEITKGLQAGTTSACAENTRLQPHSGVKPWNYLRVRGEYRMMSMMVFSNMELPPRARRIPLSSHLEAGRWGTTSACAENTGWASAGDAYRWNYLRVRGEYSPGKTSTPGFVELPPRARRIPFDGMECANLRGTTSACAENTVSASVSSGFTWNYLRVRGEYLCTAG